MLFLLVSLHAATTDELGSDDEYNDNGDQVKNIAIQVDEPIVITDFQYGVYNYGSNGAIHLVLYTLQGGNTWTLAEDQEAVKVPADKQGWAESGPIQWVLEPGTYAIGAFIPDSWYYYYSQQTSGDVWFGSVLGGVRVDATSVPDKFSADFEQYYYWMKITSESADADGDGLMAETWGGTDCDDADATIGESTTEIAYDGVDQDCDGSDLVDVDADGSIAQDAGGDDCDDNDASLIGPCAGEGPDGDGTGGSKLSAAGCGCAVGTSPVGLWGMVALAGALVRRRR